MKNKIQLLTMAKKSLLPSGSKRTIQETLPAS